MLYVSLSIIILILYNIVDITKYVSHIFIIKIMHDFILIFYKSKKL